MSWTLPHSRRITRYISSRTLKKTFLNEILAFQKPVGIFYWIAAKKNQTCPEWSLPKVKNTVIQFMKFISWPTSIIYLLIWKFNRLLFPSLQCKHSKFSNNYCYFHYDVCSGERPIIRKHYSVIFNNGPYRKSRFKIYFVNIGSMNNLTKVYCGLGVSKNDLSGLSNF